MTEKLYEYLVNATGVHARTRTDAEANAAAEGVSEPIWWANNYPGTSNHVVFDDTTELRTLALKEEVYDYLFERVSHLTFTRVTSAIAVGMTGQELTDAQALLAWREAVVAEYRSAVTSGDDPVWPEMTTPMKVIVDQF